MGDIPLNKPAKSAKNKKPSNTAAMLEAQAETEKSRADAAEATIREMENTPIRLVVLDSAEFNNILKQKTLMEEAVNKANTMGQEAADAQGVALMMNSAYSATWTLLQKKHGLPDDVDVDWTTGEIFRKKIQPLPKN